MGLRVQLIVQYVLTVWVKKKALSSATDVTTSSIIAVWLCGRKNATEREKRFFVRCAEHPGHHQHLQDVLRPILTLPRLHIHHQLDPELPQSHLLATLQSQELQILSTCWSKEDLRRTSLCRGLSQFPSNIGPKQQLGVTITAGTWWLVSTHEIG